ncbi:MAG: hypothetical protein IPG50_26860 [Myxococcales bacterium]|nr:hypothetical protein [Myxococcales bacterium]
MAISTLIAAVGVNCTDDETGPAPSSALDASLGDVSAPQLDGSGAQPEASLGDSAVPADAGAGDATVVDAGALDSGADSAALDGGVDSGPLLDDAGCPVFAGPLPELGDAGFPTTGLALWLRGDRGVATVDGGAVCRWDDMSGNGRSFKPGAAQAPVFSPTGIRNLPAVSFVGNRPLVREDVLGIAPTSARTFAIFQAIADTTHRISFYQGNFATNDVYFGIDQNTFQTVGGREGVYIAGNAYDSNITTSGQPRSHIYSISSMVPDGGLPGVLTYAVDNTLATLTRTPGGTGNSKVWDFSGAHRTGMGFADATFTGGAIGEVLIFDRELDASERTAVHQYFQSHFPP